MVNRQILLHSLTLDGHTLAVEDVILCARHWDSPEQATVGLSEEARERIIQSRQAVETLIESSAVVYGITTGFGHLQDRFIPPEKSTKLQRNLIVSHSVGVGTPLEPETVRALMLIRANTLAKGNSGIRLEVVQMLLDMINRGVYPVIPCKGSVGASGDLAPLAHMVLVLLGEGEAFYQGERLPGKTAMQRAGLETTELFAKEGLALINGTAVMTAHAVWAVHLAELLTQTADIAGAVSLEALNGTRDAFDPRIHEARAHPHQIACASFMRELLNDSELTRSFDPKHVQDAYSLRCIPQVHGAIRDAVSYGKQVVERELNAAVDNPLLFWDDEGRPQAISGGNFHGEPIALVMDFLSNAMTELGNISERRIARLIDPALNDGLPAFLAKDSGINSGFMLPQYTAASLASENKVLAHPASADTIPTSANTEDHVSMGTTSARQAREIIENVTSILAIELISAAQAVDFRRGDTGLRFGKGTGAAYEIIREHVPFLDNDCVMYSHIENMQTVVRDGQLVRSVQETLAA